MIINIILWYVLLQILSGGCIFVSIAEKVVFSWINSLKNGTSIPFDAHNSILIDELKKSYIKNMKKADKAIKIPILNIFYMNKLANNSFKETMASKRYLKRTHEICSLEQAKLNSIIGENKFNIIKQTQELSENLSDSKNSFITPYKTKTNKTYYAIAVNFTRDQADYISYGTKMHAVYGNLDGRFTAILGALSKKEIEEYFPTFIQIDESEITTQKFDVIAMHMPDEATVNYIVTDIIVNTFTKKLHEPDIIDTEVQEINEETKNTKTR